tara:strand:+ start:1155 stop:2273 length:1119 start_codon:yes stop_codon:yes gene_type:complete
VRKLQRNGFKVRMFQRAMRFANLLAALPNKLVPPPFRLIQIGSAYWQSRALYVATELGVADTIGDDELPSDEIATKLKLDSDYLYRLLRMLASIGVFEESTERHFRNNKLSDCLRSTSRQNVSSMILLHNSPEMSHAWFEELGPALRSGEVPFVQSHGEELFDYLDHHPKLDNLFTSAMESVEALTGSDYLDDFDWGQFDRIIDVGGSSGSKSIAILNRHPHLQALIFDRPQVIENALLHRQKDIDSQVLARITYSGGNMLESIPSACSERNIFLLFAIFHGMGNPDAEKILINLREAFGQHRASIAIVDCVADAKGIDPTVASFDMQMLIGTRGRERTETEWKYLLERCGFVLQEVISLRTFAKLLLVRLK